MIRLVGRYGTRISTRCLRSNKLMSRYRRWTELSLSFTEAIDIAGMNAQWNLKSKEIKVLRNRPAMSKFYSILHELCHVGIDILFGMNKFGLCSVRFGIAKQQFHTRLDRLSIMIRHTKHWYTHKNTFDDLPPPLLRSKQERY